MPMRLYLKPRIEMGLRRLLNSVAKDINAM